MTKKAPLAIALLILAILLLGLFLPTLYWDGAVPVKLLFHIVDSSNHKPIPGAVIRVSTATQLLNLHDTNVLAKIPSATSDSEGHAIIQIRCGAGGTSSLFHKTGRYGIRHELAIEAAGCRPMNCPLENILGSSSFKISKREFDIELSLLKAR
jgi:hypothetical protein